MSSAQPVTPVASQPLQARGVAVDPQSALERAKGTHQTAPLGLRQGAAPLAPYGRPLLLIAPCGRGGAAATWAASPGTGAGLLHVD
eukprot:CAMPEP_0197928146 /NCGR_PEP_ID=MMETSP1439-20131203/101849_1 /TAXON_ID=66791 /ORGANISM="Gonyaulax spinifera, Strain CCMP409" /LENGTH=85 /DNA_ID=CAMNT_0043550739 /DNA_START=16 /DNA_END=270 /DNA_ORIENTATION=+